MTEFSASSSLFISSPPLAFSLFSFLNMVIGSGLGLGLFLDSIQPIYKNEERGPVVMVVMEGRKGENWTHILSARFPFFNNYNYCASFAGGAWVFLVYLL